MLDLHGLTREEIDEFSADLTHLINEKMKREGLVSKFILARKPKEKGAIYEEWCNLVNVGTDGHIDNTAHTFITQEVIDNFCESMRKYSDAIGRVPKIYITLNPRGESPMFKLWREAVAQGVVELVTSADKADTEVKLGKEWAIIDELSESPPKQQPIVKPKPDYVKFHSRWGR